MGCDDSVEVGPNAVYAEFGYQLYAVSKSSGKIIGLYDGHGYMFDAILANGNIHFHTREEDPGRYYIRSLDASDGTLEWEYPVDGQVTGPPAVYEGSVYYTATNRETGDGSGYSYLLSLDASSGELNWKYLVDKGANTTAIEHGGHIYFGGYSDGNHHLYSVDPLSGELITKYRTWGTSHWTPLIAGGNAYIVARGGSLYSMDLSTGEKNWDYLTGGRASGPPMLSDGNLYFLVADKFLEEYRSLHAVDAATGSLKWQYKRLVKLKGPTVSNGSVYVSTRDDLVSLDAVTGIPNWQTDYGISCGRLAAADRVLYGHGLKTHGHGFITFAIRAD